MTEDDKDRRLQELAAEIVQLREENARLLAQIEELERRLGMNSKNSSKPPSSDPPHTRPSASDKPEPKKRGARHGHTPHIKELLPPEQVTEKKELEPTRCPSCGGTHFTSCDEPPLRDQFIDLPQIQPTVMELVRPVRECATCGAHVHAPLPEDAPKSCFGPGVLALIAILTGVLNISKRKAQHFMEEVVHVPISLGGLSECEEQIAAALARPYEEAADHVRRQDVAHADETGWRRGNRAKGWLWTLCCAGAAVFMVHAKRGREAAKTLLGTFLGILVTDRWGGYNEFAGKRQICWAHLKRDFLAVSEVKGRLGEIGKALHALTGTIFVWYRRVRDGTLSHAEFQRWMSPVMAEVEALLAEGASYPGALGGKCRAILAHREHLWTFVEHPNVEPTNNHAERIIRQGVLWRKTSLGTQSERGARYVERALTVSATCRLQGRSAIEFLHETCRCHQQNLPAPSLFE